MSDPVPYSRTYSFTDYQAGNPSAPLPGIQVDNELENVEQSLGGAIDAIKDVRRSDGKLKNGIVTVDSLDPTVAAGVGAGALASAQAAAASADAASDSAVAAAASATAASGSATAASGYASNALTSRNAASGFADDSAAAASLSQTARDYASKWATEAENVTVNDGVNPTGYSAYHWAQVALDAAAGSIADGSVTTAKLANGALSADATGRAKMADGFVTSAKIADGTISAGDLADGAVATAKIADGALSADSTGRAKLADGFLTAVKAAADFVFGQTAKTTPVDADCVLISDSAASNAPKKLTFSNLKAWMLTLFNASGSAPVYAARAWVSFNGTGTLAIRGSGNVSSVTDNGTGDYTVNFTTAMSDALYTAVASASADLPSNWAGSIAIHTSQTATVAPTTSATRLAVRNAANSAADYPYISCAIFR